MTTPGEAPRVLNVRDDPRDHVPASADFDATLPAFGDLARLVSVGSLRVTINGLDNHLAALIDDGYRGFVEPVAASPAGSRIDVVRAPTPSYLYLPRAEGRSEEARVGARGTEAGLELWSYFFAARFDRDARAGRLLLCDAADLDVSQGIENTLRFFVSAAALASGGFLLHSAGVAREGRAWLFFGPSGSGKSTTASNAPADAQLLGDDLVLIEEHAGTWRACGVPFRGTFARGDNAASTAPVAMAFRLFQSDECRIEQVPRIVQVAELLGEVPFLLDDAVMQERAAGIVERFTRDVPVRRLHLRRDGSYWRVITG